MGGQLHYQVFPNKPKPVLPKPVGKTKLSYRSAEVKGIGEAGCIVAIVVFVPLFLLANFLSCSGLCGPKSDSYETFRGIIIGGFLSCLCTGAAVWVIHIILKQKNVARLEAEIYAKAVKSESQRHAEATRNEKALVEEEAASITTDLRHIYEASTQLAAELREHLDQALLWMNQAEGEYNDNAAYLFWDAIETAALQLASFKEKADKLAKHSGDYYKILNGRKHNFPSFPIGFKVIPNVSPLLNEFHRLTRLGHTNTHFTNMLAHHKMQQVITGFRSLNDVMRTLPFSVKDSISDLQESISSDVARLVEEEISAREIIAETEGKNRNTN